MVPLFRFARIPRIIYGPGESAKAGEIASALGQSILLVTGESSLRDSGALDTLLDSLKSAMIDIHLAVASGEPSPDLIDDIVAQFADECPEVVLAAGGGSVIDTGKAVSAMLPLREPVADYLEGIGSKTHPGTKVPFIAIPTTAGTGSEATKNAVLSRTGHEGFKKSLRHDNLVPDVAIVDPQLAVSCPAELTAACGMDALTQLLESYVSTKASPITDAFVLDGLRKLTPSLPAACTCGDDLEARAGMAYAALVSGITLANAGLGVVHGLASLLGGGRPIPHGVVCGTLLAAATRATIACLRQDRGSAAESLVKYARAGAILAGARVGDVDGACDALADKLEEWVDKLGMPRLGTYGFTESELRLVALSAESKNNPAPLAPEDVARVLLERL